jgi:hypothetical protein
MNASNQKTPINGNAFTIRNISDEVFLGVKVWAKAQDKTVESALRGLLSDIAQPKKRIKLGTLLKQHSSSNPHTSDSLDALNTKSATLINQGLSI